MRLNARVLFAAAALSAVSVAACSSDTSTSGPSSGPIATGNSTVPTSSETSPSVTVSPVTVAPEALASATAPTIADSATTDPIVSEPTSTGSSSAGSSNTGSSGAASSSTGPADRPFEVFVPTSYEDGKATPLVILLHGYSASGDIQEAYFGLQPLAERRGFLYVHPDGTKNALGNQFWNATGACCGFGSDVDDSAFIMSIIRQVARDYDVDPKRIFLIGHSNGGFMSYEMACDHADTIAAIVSLAGAAVADTSECSPSEPVSVLQIHGTADATISYDGGSILGQPYPSAQASVATWAAYDGCDDEAAPLGEPLDLAAQIDGAESSVRSFGGCPSGIDVELWTIAGGPHVPALSPTFAARAIDFLLSHPKP